MYPCQNKMLKDIIIHKTVDSDLVEYRIYCPLTDITFYFQTSPSPLISIPMCIEDMINRMCSDCPYKNP